MTAGQANVEKALALANAGRVAEAYSLLEAAIESGDAFAAGTLADWRMSGSLIRRDLGLARELYGRAAELGLDAAEPIYIALLANGAGGTGRYWEGAVSALRRRSHRDPLAREQLALLDRMNLDAEGDPVTLARGKVVSASPHIARFDRFLTSEECKHLIQRAFPLLQDSVVVHPTTGALIRDPIRTSKAAAFPFVSEDPLIHALNRRIAAATGTTYEQGEPLQILSYEPGQEYKLHSDALPPGANQRVMTFLVYLNEDYDGGETCFPDLDLAFRGRAGDALLFRNVDEAGEPDLKARHCGRPVRRGRKMLLSKWIRSAPLDLSGPPGRPF